MGRDLEEHARQEEEWRLRLSDRVKLGAALAGTGVAVLLLWGAGPQCGRPVLLNGLFWVVGATMVLGGLAVAGWALRERHTSHL